MGTPLYIPPEICLREAATERSDLYAFGFVLYELLAGELPHAGRARELHIDDVLYRDAEPIRTRFPDVLPSFAALVDQCLRRNPAERPASAAAVAETLERIGALFLGRAESTASLHDDDARLVCDRRTRTPRGDGGCGGPRPMKASRATPMRAPTDPATLRPPVPLRDILRGLSA